jgi:hypothetical protein
MGYGTGHGPDWGRVSVPRTGRAGTVRYGLIDAAPLFAAEVAVYETLKDEAEESFSAGLQVFDLASGGVELASSGGYIEPYRDRLEELRDRIIDGEIDVPRIPAARAEQAAELGITGCGPVP